MLDHYEYRLNGGPWISTGLDTFALDVAGAVEGTNTVDVAAVFTNGRRKVASTTFEKPA